MSILPDHLGGMTPTLPAFPLNGGNLHRGFVGRPIDPTMPPNPGSPNGGDSRYAERLIEMFGNDRRIIYIIGDHSGEIGYYDGGLLATAKHWSPHHRVVTLAGDACIVDYGKLGRKPCTVVLRTWDCGNLIITNPKDRKAALVHCSITTEAGYKAENNFAGPISAQVMREMGNPRDCYVAAGPSAAGIASNPPCWCYEFDQPDADTFFSLAEHAHPTVSLDGLGRPRATKGKHDIAFGEWLARVFESYGLRRKLQIDLTCNICTCCNPNQFYCNRHTRRELRNGCSDDEHLVHEQQMNARYGNLAYLHLN